MDMRLIALTIAGISGLYVGILIKFIRYKVPTKRYVFIPFVPLLIFISFISFALTAPPEKGSTKLKHLTNIIILSSSLIFNLPTLIGITSYAFSARKEIENTREIVVSKISEELSLSWAC